MFRTAVVLTTLLALAASFAVADLTESFSGSTTPPGWTIQGYDAANGITTGTPLTDAYWFGSQTPYGYLRLTDITPTNGYDRTSAFWTGISGPELFWSDNWTLTVDIRVGRSAYGDPTFPDGADGLAFTWVDANSISGTGDLIGGTGDWMGTPRGTSQDSVPGYVAGIQGYSFQFDDFRNTGEPSYEFTSLVDINDWTTAGGTVANFSADNSFYLNEDWQTVQLDNNSGNFTFYWGPGLANSYSWSVSNLPNYGAYFGITASTGQRRAYHEIRNFNLDAVLVPEPGTMALLLLGLGAGGAWVRRRRKTEE